MDLGIIGLIDIFIILLAIIAIIVGYVRGFMKKMLSWVGFLILIAFAILFTTQIAHFCISHNIIYPSIYDKIFGKVDGWLSAHQYKSYSVTIEKSFGIPAFLATIFSLLMGNPKINKAEGAPSYQVQVSTKISESIMNVIAFLIIFVIVLIFMAILKIICAKARENKVVRVTDGLLGIALYLVLLMFTLSFIFFVTKLVYDAKWFPNFNKFLEKDLQLNSNKFRISKSIYQSNIFESIKDFVVSLFK